MIAVSSGSQASYPFSGAGMRPHRFILPFIETAGQINEFMKIHGVNLAERGLMQAEMSENDGFGRAAQKIDEHID